LREIIGPMRLPFLFLTPACVSVGLGTALWTSGHINLFYFILALLGALSAHISVNALNEYFDFKSGLDLETKPTPFSGGSGTLPSSPDKAYWALLTGIVTFGITGLIGIYFLRIRGFALLPLGLLGLLIVFFYTPWITHNPWLCLIAPGLGFGPLMVMGTDFVLTGTYSWTAFAASLVPFFLVNNLLLLNEFPDMKADKKAGRRNLPIIFGARRSAIIYGVFIFLTYLLIIVSFHFDLLPRLSLIALSTMVIALPTFIGVLRYYMNTEKLVPYMGLNVIITIATPLLIAAGLILIC